MQLTLCSRPILIFCGVSRGSWYGVPSGRQRFNMLGVLYAVTHQLITVTNDSYINSASVGELLEKIAGLELYDAYHTHHG